MSKIGTKKKIRTIVFYFCVAIVLALVWMNWQAISYGIIILLDNLLGTFKSLLGG